MAQQLWCKVASDLDSNPKIRRGGNLCRQVYEFALRQNSLTTNPVPGFVRAAELSPWFVADRLMMSEADARTGLEKCLIGDDELGPLLVREGMAYRIDGWEEEQWGRGKGSDERAVKVAEARARGGKARAESARRDGAGAFAPAASQHNTIVLDQLPASAPAHAGQLDCAGPADEPAQPSCQLDVRRKTVDERRETRDERDTGGAGDSPAATPALLPRKPRSKARPNTPTEAEMASARTVLAKFAEVGNRVEYRGSESHVALIVRQLRNGVTEEDMRKIIGYVASPKIQGGKGWEDSDQMRDQITPEVLFGPKNIDRYLDNARSAYSSVRKQSTPTSTMAVSMLATMRGDESEAS